MKGVVVIDAAVLFESGMQGMVDKIIVVDCDEQEQIARLVHKGMDADEAKLRIKSQMPKAEKAAKADYVIDNNGSLEKTYDEVKKLWEKLK
jgi:dephospho-CoA kinase